ncbi:MAG TPA: DUF6263 family protein [Gemmataceae bacterium]|nr:DUF6263 family protein [Gemmataceae bacterium]
MLKLRWIAGLLCLAALAPVFAQDKDKAKDKAAKDKGEGVKLAWKFEKGKPFYQEMTTETKQTMKVMGSDVVQNQKQTFYFSWTPEKQEADGSWVIQQEILGVKMDIDIGGSKISYDSTKTDNPANPLGEFFKALIGSKFTLTVDKNNKVTKVEGRKEFLDKLAAANPQMKPLLDQILSEEALKEMADPTFAVVPTKEVKKGDTWEKTSKLDMGPIGKYENSYKYTFEGPDAKTKLDKIKVDTTLKYVPPSDSATGGSLPFKIKSADLKSTDASGTVTFDNAKGRVASSEQKLNLKGDLSIEIGGQTTKVELNQTQTTTVKTTDTNPVPKK